jgi:hypothetical protein
MNWRRNLSLLLAIAAGFIGGSLSHYVTVPSVHAEAQPNKALEIRAQKFTFVDYKGHVVASFVPIITAQDSFNPSINPRDSFNPKISFALVDAEGHELWAAGGSGFKPLAANPR